MDTGYEPLYTLKTIGPNIWIIDGPVIRFYGLPFPTRMTVIRLQNGDLFVHSPIDMNDALVASLAELGEVKHLVSPNWIHYASIGVWANRFPAAIAWASPGVRQRARKKGVRVSFDRDLEATAAPDWQGEIDQIVVEGSKIHREVVFFHKTSKTLILTDLIENFEATKIPLWFLPLARIVGILDNNGGMPRDMRATFRKGRAALRASVETMINWAPEKVVISHGRWFESGGVAELRRVLDWVLK